MKSVGIVLVSAVIMLVTMPALIRYLKKHQMGQTMYELGPQAHLSKQGTPNMGGVLIGSITVAVSIAFSFLDHGLWALFPLLLLAIAAMAIGFADDYIKDIGKQHEGLKPRQKVIDQVMAGLLFSLYCYYAVGSQVRLPFTDKQWDLGLMYIPLMTVLVVFMTNSANLQDGADGLLSSVTVVGGIAFGVIALMLTPMVEPVFGGAVSTAMFALVGACLGFLWYNRHPAQIMMGDTGSMFIGGVFTAGTMLLGLQLWLIPICFTMIMSSVSVIMQRAYFKATKGKRIFKMSPIHHHFELSGMSENQILRMYALVTLVLSALAVVATLPMIPR